MPICTNETVLHQQVVAVADSLTELISRLDARGTAADEAAIIEASADYDSTFIIWSPGFIHEVSADEGTL